MISVDYHVFSSIVYGCFCYFTGLGGLGLGGSGFGLDVGTGFPRRYTGGTVVVVGIIYFSRLRKLLLLK